ncbi:hypothetical protein ACO2Q3_01795 [Caulobacter sp. KR2-114]|uniref:hypothetical protein n=1 Tax=Caulobacter sp. KR2-114 TaxID=3400912 RepID=UPI003C02D46F
MTNPTPNQPSPDTAKPAGADKGAGGPDVQGEGDYEAARKFDREERSFVESGKVEAGAKAAKDALDGPEGADLEAARHAAARGETLKKP